MKQGEIQELKNKPKEELTTMLGEMNKKLHELTFDLLEGKVKNVKSLRETKKTIARIQTFLRQK